MYLKNPILFIVSSLCPFITLAQNEYKLNGHIRIKGGVSFPYMVAFKLKGPDIKGHSITTLKNNVQAKASIKGSINKTTQTISFTEFPFEEGDDNTITCFVNTTLSISLSGNKQVLNGEFTGKDYYGAYCGEGTIILTPTIALCKQLGITPQRQKGNANEINGPPNKIQTTKNLQERSINNNQYAAPYSKEGTATQPAPKDKKEPGQSKNSSEAAKLTSTEQQRSKLNTPQHHSHQKTRIHPSDTIQNYEDGKEYEITSGITQQFQWYSDTCILDIYDGGVIDGDKITVIFNADEVLSSHTLTKQKHQMKLYLKGKINTISIIAENLGKTPPNTANFTLTDGKRHYKIKAFNDIGESAEITLKKK